MSEQGIMILGAGIMQLPAFEAAKRNGWKTIAADGNPDAPCKAKADLFLHIDLKDRVALAEAAAEYKDQYSLKGVFTCGTDFSASVAWVVEKAGFPGISYQTALDCTDKYRMRKRFMDADVPCPRFCEFSLDMDLKKETRDLSYPLVVKPVDNMGGRGVITAHDFQELMDAVEQAVSYSRTERAIIEEFMDGPEFSIDSLVYDDKIEICGFADRHIFYPPCFIEMGHTLPSIIDGEQKDEIFRVFRNAVKSLGITIGSAKGDIKLTENGVMIGEIAARLSGGYMSGWTYPYASGLNLVEKGMILAMGGDPGEIKESQTFTSSERAFISIPGKISGLRNIEEAHDITEVKDLFLLKDIGDEAEFPMNNVMKCGNVIAVAPDREDALKASENAVSMIRIDLEQGNQKTLDFLEIPLDTLFPPKAYDYSKWEELSFLNDFKPDFTMKYHGAEIPVPPSGERILEDRDWNSVCLADALKECLAAGLSQQADSWTLFARHFWYVLVRAGIQGALWYIDFNNEEH